MPLCLPVPARYMYTGSLSRCPVIQTAVFVNKVMINEVKSYESWKIISKSTGASCTLFYFAVESLVLVVYVNAPMPTSDNSLAFPSMFCIAFLNPARLSAINTSGTMGHCP